jgi:hypothetical protein
MHSDTHELIKEVMDGNPGAYTVIRDLIAFPTWYQLLHHLKTRRMVGSELWRVVKDDYSHDLAQFVEDQLAQMPPERAHTLRALGRSGVARYN